MSKEIRFELRKAHEQYKKPMAKRFETIAKFLLNTNKDPFDYDVQVWYYDGNEWHTQDLSGDEFLIQYVHAGFHLK